MTVEDVANHPWFKGRESVYVRWYPKRLHAEGTIAAAISASTVIGGCYIHVPFCDHLCAFCPFNKRQTETALVARYANALVSEIDLYGTYISHCEPLRFVYFGGGSPSVLSPDQLARITDALHRVFGLSANCEVTLETHPSHGTLNYLRGVRSAGITRISTGVQSFDDGRLRALGSQHNVDDVRTILSSARAAFGCVSIDLLYRCPGQTLGEWRHQLKQATQQDVVAHVSCYSVILPDAAHQPSVLEDVEMAVAAHEDLSDAGFQHYASCASGGFDFAREDHDRCRYEQEHWGAPQANFIGFGPGAFGFLGTVATVNGLGIHQYCDTIERQQLPLASVTVASHEELMRRYFVLGAKANTVPLSPFEERFGRSAGDVFHAEFEQLRAAGLVRVASDALEVTPVGRFYVDDISATFFSETERGIPHPEEPEVRRVEVMRRRLAATL